MVLFQLLHCRYGLDIWKGNNRTNNEIVILSPFHKKGEVAVLFSNTLKRALASPFTKN